MKRRHFGAGVLAAVLLLCLSLAGCGAPAGGSSAASVSSAEASAAAVSSAPAEAAQETTLATPSTTGALQVRGTQLTDGSGRPVQLRGVSTHGLAWFPQYVNEDCFRQLREWGANAVRLAMYSAESGGYCTGGDQSSLRALVQQGVESAAAADLYVIVDWHILSDNDPNDHLAEAKTFFAEISAANRDRDHVLYEICNEPNGATTWAQVKDYAEAVIPVIRQNDPDAVVLVGTPEWCQRVDQAAADPLTTFENVMYTLHFYAATHKADLRKTMADAVAAGLPVFVSEFGICDASGSGAIDTGEAGLWVQEMDKLGISYLNWSLCNKAEAASLLRPDCEKTAGFAAQDLSESGRWLTGMLSAHLES